MATWADVERIAASLPQTAPGKASGLVAAPKRLARGFLASRGPQEAP